jgi:transcriptional regulator with XRE-family HTH domain
MARTRGFVTTAQRIAAANEQRRQRIADGLAAYKRRERITDEELGQRLSVARNTVAKILRGEEVALPTDTHFRVLAASGYQMRKVEPETLD